jgi:hypothetical protein
MVSQGHFHGGLSLEPISSHILYSMIDLLCNAYVCLFVVHFRIIVEKVVDKVEGGQP